MRVNLAQARLIAEKAIEQHRRQAARLAGYAFAPAQLKGETAAFWHFFVYLQQLSDTSHIPGGLSALVDKHDGHIWSHAEQEAYSMKDAAQPALEAA